MDRLNPAYLYAFIADVFALIVGFGLIQVTDVQVDLVLKTIAALILLITGTAVPVAGVINEDKKTAFELGYTRGKMVADRNLPPVEN